MSVVRRAAGVGVDLVGVSLLAAGSVMVAKAMKGRADIRSELAAQRIRFPGSAKLPRGLGHYAGQFVTTGHKARAYSELIRRHVETATGGRTYSEVSDELMAGDRTDEKLVELRQIAFMGEMLRGSLLNAYQAWQVTSLVTGLGVLTAGLGGALLAIRALAEPAVSGQESGPYSGVLR